MPTVTLNKKALISLIGKGTSLNDAELADRISYLGTDLESIGDEEISVEVFPNRPDLLSEQGLGRALSSFLGIQRGLRKYKVKKSGKKLIVDKSVSKVRPYTACAIVKGLVFDDEKIREVIQMQEKLHTTYCRNRKKAAIGIYPLEKITFPITYSGRDPKRTRFIPLEEDNEMDGFQILSEHPTGKEYSSLLEGQELFPYFIDAKEQVLSMPPIINSEQVGRITEDTKDVFIEFSGFDYKVLSIGLNMIVTALADMGGSIYSLDIEYPDVTRTSPVLDPWELRVNISDINNLLGLDIDDSHLKELLENMGYSYDKGIVKVPCYRADVLHWVDIAEDAAIAYGYENFSQRLPDKQTIGSENNMEKIKKKVSEILIGLGLQEVSTYHLSNKKSQTENILLDDSSEKDIVELSNSLTTDYSLLRRRLFPVLLEVIKRNRQHEYPQRIFETGAVFMKDSSKNTETGVKEEEHLSVILCGEKENYTSIRQVLDYLFRLTGNKNIKIIPEDYPFFISGRSASISVGNKNIGFLGELHPKVLETLEIEMPISLLEMDCGFF